MSEVLKAKRRIRDHIIETPTIYSTDLSSLHGAEVFLKMEHHQITGSFKLRGATNTILQLTKQELSRGVVTASTGNHGRAVAYAAKAAGSSATICMSRLVPENKVSEIIQLGADVRITGSSYDEAESELGRLVNEEGRVIVHASDDPAIIAGQGTIGLEIVEAVPNVGTVLVPLGSGGLSAGIASAVKAMRRHARVIGLTMERGAAMKASLEAGHPVQVKEYESLADALCGGIGLNNKLTFTLCRDLLDDVILLSESEISAGIRYAYDHENEVLEGAGAIGVASLVAGKIPRIQGPTVVVLSGRNIGSELHRRLIAGEHVPFGEPGDGNDHN
ncbi:MAG: hydroxyectoine utilization dehydratase EutB [Mesorhizobium sp.]|uniref:hydroxyectoine utilization dehydratase EutB n=1 Tax=Mesorhizobium sp. TaxID=1871066 RepID=UPI000FE31FEF|nr:hydroxyectoine utilization dehydratase EutB [Mesorhizobium sp.]RWG80879.1 MAG: hydroxyectoine utilization dehydratase EutB [Mesorhizobium sp.]RWI44245.1 MAG: hydroxyectoine utilization dehydratase EutB [Mesorhizobium sp.]RWJ25252.1 MAG: hydroxyectoine utilization dehydratase EutB [Mesorhizobium sp.]RWJ89666.1 MAG: hydroxyectoine utilization dehydratase EutB [Mesorhizobium sp.]RWK15046.1 MAG: hydroxyectoine utilization dehydratase EutB [Mesorhizobium sp.]